MPKLDDKVNSFDSLLKELKSNSDKSIEELKSQAESL